MGLMGGWGVFGGKRWAGAPVSNPTLTESRRPVRRQQRHQKKTGNENVVVKLL